MLQLFDDYIRCLSTGINITHLVVSDEVLGVVIEAADCLYGPADATAPRNFIVFCLIYIQTGFTF